MKKYFYSLLLLIVPFTIAAQCNPADHDWGTATFGVSPDPNAGENFDPAVQNQPYADVVYVKSPSGVGDVIPEYEDVPLAIDSISLDSITIFNGIADVQISTIGLNMTCNNNGDSPNPCMFLPGNSYCGDIQGTPTVNGSYPVKIFVTVFFNFFGQQSIPYSFEGYTLDIAQDPNSIDEVVSTSLTLGQNNPNPASLFTNISFQLGQAQDVTLIVTNLLGEVVNTRMIKGRRGDNNFRFETSSLETGVYLYTIQTSDKKLTRKMIVQH